jgi:hypothetical protein
MEMIVCMETKIAGNSAPEGALSPDSVGEAVLADALRVAQGLFGGRLVAAYALGSLAHGGFSPHVSDVDAAFILAEPPDAGDAKLIECLAAEVKSGGAPLSDRLSVFWGTASTLAGAANGGRFPPLDRLDLKLYGRLMYGRDVREWVRAPDVKELVLATARMALSGMATAEVTARLRDPSGLAAAGVRPLTKRVLFPVRFVYTARTGQIGRNDVAVEYFTGAESGAPAALARQAFMWRSQPYRAGDPGVVRLVAEGLLPLYRLFIDDYEPRLRSYGEAALADGFAEWRERLE